jgi:hypothetical protein
MPIRDRLEMLYDKFLENSDWIQKQPKPEDYDNTGSATAVEISHRRFFAIAEYILHGDVPAFRRQLVDAAKLQIQLFHRYDEGTLQGDGSYVSIVSQDQLFDALAAGAFDVAEEFARHLGGRAKIEKGDLPLRIALGYSLKHCVLNDADELRDWLVRLKEVCKAKKYQGFEAFVHAFQGILDGDLSRANKGIAGIAANHRRAMMDPGWFADTEDELLSVWGIGVANLARYRGLQVDAVPPYIPNDLLIDGTQV